jgi:hypothetical protein
MTYTRRYLVRALSSHQTPVPWPYWIPLMAEDWCWTAWEIIQWMRGRR